MTRPSGIGVPDRAQPSHGTRVRPRRGGHRHLPGLMIVPVILFVLATAPPAHSIPPTSLPAQFQTEPHPLDTFLTDILNFQNPTGIRGTVRTLDLDGPVLWLNWAERSDDAPGFQTGWRIVPGEALLAVHPRPSDSLIDLRTLRNGDAVELVIQFDAEGKRRILSFRDMSQPPKVPL